MAQVKAALPLQIGSRPALAKVARDLEGLNTKPPAEAALTVEE